MREEANDREGVKDYLEHLNYTVVMVDRKTLDLLSTLV